ncbi:hypothetical protein TrCOL_g8724 [Triparma columacea]|uniref:Uncharacterized protein n=1 Tax=Triparma columacea TaxID=722753 RepID=A0A9W7LCT0_9STRA|nr:hypothetical protein TrCOL_g8724 [Triparma columacea]
MERKEVIKLCGLLFVFTACYFSGKTIVDSIEALRGEWVHWPFGAIIPVIVVVQYVRRCVPPIYGICGPISSVVLLIFADKLGAYHGALLYQSMKLEELIIMPSLRYLYSQQMEQVIEGGEEIWWLSNSFRRGLKMFDDTYSEIVVGASWSKQWFTVWMFNMTYFFNDYVCLFWFSTRSKMPYFHYCGAYVVGIVLEYPKTLFKFKIYTGLLDAASSSSFWDVFAHAADFAWYELLLFGLTTCCATLFVHGLHIRMVFRACVGNRFKEEGVGVVEVGVVEVGETPQLRREGEEVKKLMV